MDSGREKGVELYYYCNNFEKEMGKKSKEKNIATQSTIICSIHFNKSK